MYDGAQGIKIGLNYTRTRRSYRQMLLLMRERHRRTVEDLKNLQEQLP